MHVFGGSAVKLLFQVPAFAVAGSPTDFSFNPGAGGAGDNASAYPFVVRVGLQNLTDFPVYLPSVSLFDLANDPTRQSPPDTYGPHSPFESQLDSMLRGLGTETLIISGAWTNMSIEHTARHAADGPRIPPAHGRDRRRDRRPDRPVRAGPAPPRAGA